MGNVTVTVKKRQSMGNAKGVIVDITGSASYATNGDSIVAGDIAKLVPETKNLADIDLFEAEDSSAGHAVYLDRTNAKIKFFNGTTEIANATNLSAVTCRCRIVYGGAAGPLN